MTSQPLEALVAEIAQARSSLAKAQATPAVAKIRLPRKTGRPCKVCCHPKRAEIELASLRTNAVAVSRRFHVPDQSVLAHMAKHLPEALVESSEASEKQRREEWWVELQSRLDRTVAIADDPASARAEVVSAIRAAGDLLRTKGQGLKIIGDNAINVWLEAGYKDAGEAQADRELRESIKTMSANDIHAQFMEFERRFALESPGVGRDYLTLMELAGGRIEQAQIESESE